MRKLALAAWDANKAGDYGLNDKQLGDAITILDTMVQRCKNGRFTDNLVVENHALIEPFRLEAMKLNFRTMTIDEVEAWTPEP